MNPHILNKAIFNKMKYLLSLALVLVSAYTVLAQDRSNPAGTVQEDKPAPAPVEMPVYLRNETDPLGRVYVPRIGQLNPPLTPGVRTEMLSKLNIGFFNGVRGDANTPYELLPKERVVDLADFAQGKQPADIQRAYPTASLGVQYLMQLRVNHVSVTSGIDSVFTTENSKRKFDYLRKTYYYEANLTYRLTDVATSKLVIVNNLKVECNTAVKASAATANDSLNGFKCLYEEARKLGTRALKSALPGVGVVTSLDLEDDGKAQVVLVNANELMNKANIGTEFEVFQLLETFKAGDQTFHHSERIGRVVKPKDYNWKRRNFAVDSGKKEIAAALKAGQVLMCTPSQLPMAPLAPGVDRSSVWVDTLLNKSGLPGYRLRMFQDALMERLVASPQLLDLVDRDLYRELEAERRVQAAMRSDATQAGITIGADYILAGEITNYQFGAKLEYRTEMVPDPKAKPVAQTSTPAKTTTPAATSPAAAPAQNGAAKSSKLAGGSTETNTKQDKTAGKTTTTTTTPAPAAAPAPAVPMIQRTVPDHVGANASATLELRLTSVKTGELVWQGTFPSVISQQYPPAMIQRTTMIQEELTRLLAERLASECSRQVFVRLNGYSPVLKVLEVSKDKAERVLIGGGVHAGIRGKQDFEVIEVTTETVDGQSLTRETVVAKLKATEVYPETTRCKVKDGERELLAKMNSQAKLYCRMAD